MIAEAGEASFSETACGGLPGRERFLRTDARWSPSACQSQSGRKGSVRKQLLLRHYPGSSPALSVSIAALPDLRVSSPPSKHSIWHSSHAFMAQLAQAILVGFFCDLTRCGTKPGQPMRTYSCSWDHLQHCGYLLTEWRQRGLGASCFYSNNIFLASRDLDLVYVCDLGLESVVKSSTFKDAF